MSEGVSNDSSATNSPYYPTGGLGPTGSTASRTYEEKLEAVDSYIDEALLDDRLSASQAEFLRSVLSGEQAYAVSGEFLDSLLEVFRNSKKAGAKIHILKFEVRKEVADAEVDAAEENKDAALSGLLITSAGAAAGVMAWGAHKTPGSNGGNNQQTKNGKGNGQDGDSSNNGNTPSGDQETMQAGPAFMNLAMQMGQAGSSLVTANGQVDSAVHSSFQQYLASLLGEDMFDSRTYNVSLEGVT